MDSHCSNRLVVGVDTASAVGLGGGHSNCHEGQSTGHAAAFVNVKSGEQQQTVRVRLHRSLHPVREVFWQGWSTGSGTLSCGGPAMDCVRCHSAFVVGIVG